MTDVMAEFKNSKFVIAGGHLVGKISGHIVVLSDIGFWADNVDDLITWCEKNNCKTKGMTVEIPTDELLTLFCLRWA